MGSGPIAGGSDDGVAREKRRYTESKVYTRKALKGPRKADCAKKVGRDDVVAEVVEVLVPNGKDNVVVARKDFSLPTVASEDEAAVSVPCDESNVDAGPSLPTVASGEEAVVSVLYGEDNMDVGLNEVSLPKVASEEGAEVSIPCCEGNVDVGPKTFSLSMAASEEEAAASVPRVENNVDVVLKEVYLPMVAPEEEAATSVPCCKDNMDVGPNEVSLLTVGSEEEAEILVLGSKNKKVVGVTVASEENAVALLLSSENNADVGLKEVSIPAVVSEEEDLISVLGSKNNKDVGPAVASEEEAAVLILSGKNDMDVELEEVSLPTVASDEEAEVLVPSGDNNRDVGPKVSLPVVTSEEEAVVSVPSGEDNVGVWTKEVSFPMVASEEKAAVSGPSGDNNMEAGLMEVPLPMVTSEEEAALMTQPFSSSSPPQPPSNSVVVNVVSDQTMAEQFIDSSDVPNEIVPSGDNYRDIGPKVSLPVVTSEEEAVVSIPSGEDNVGVWPKEVSFPMVASEEEAAVSAPSGDNNMEAGPMEVSLPMVTTEEEAALMTQPFSSSPPPQPPSKSVVVDVISDETMAEQFINSSDVPNETVIDRLLVINNVSDETITERLPVVNEVSDDTIVVEEEGPVVPSTRGQPSGNGAIVNLSWDSKVKVNVSSRSKQEIQALRRKLGSDLNLVRSMMNKIEEKEGRIAGYCNYRSWANNIADNGSRIVQSEVGSVGITPRMNPGYNQLSVSVFENSPGLMDGMEKEKRTPKANQFYRNSEFLLAKDKFPPVESNKKSKTNGKKKGREAKSGFSMGSKLPKSCSSLLEKLMKHQYGWVFNTPVDVKGLGLHDYFSIIKHPMDLGTIKSRLSRKWYKSPLDFAEDVRLTFHNAMTYNPRGQDVHYMAEILLKMFEDKWPDIESDYNREVRLGLDYEMGLPTPTSRKTPFLPPPLDVRRVLDRSESMTVPTPKPISVTPSGRTPAPKKPKAKDLHKRDMTYDEKQKLSTNLQNLPSDKLDNIVQIIKKRNSQLFQHDDEIEVDIDNVDTETLWELDRFVSNYKKSLSKNKRKAELAQARAAAAAQRNIQNMEPAVVVVDAPTRVNTGEKRLSSSLPAPAKVPASNSSRSTSSNSSSSDSGSSSSDSETDSSSDSGSEAGQSPG